MFGLRHQSQIRRVIVGSIAVYVMYQFLTFQGPTKKLCHYQAMFGNQTILASHRMFRTIKTDISISDESPVWITSELSIVLIITWMTSKTFQPIENPILNKANFATIGTCNFCTINAIDFMKFLIGLHGKINLPSVFGKSNKQFTKKGDLS